MAEGELLTAIAGMLDGKLEPVMQKLTGLEDRMTGVEGKMSGLENRMTGVEGKMSDLESRISGLEDKTSGIEGKVTGLEEKVSAIQKISVETQKELTEVKMHIENVTDKNLVNKLDENNKVTDVQLAYQIKVNFLIDDMEKMKKEIAQLKSHIA